MSLQENTKNIKSYILFIDGLVVVVLLMMSFLLGQMSIIISKHDGIAFIEGTEIEIKTDESASNIGKNSIYASRTGTKYYYVWCNESRIKEENKVWFSSTDEAKSKGYEKARNCVGD